MATSRISTGWKKDKLLEWSRKVHWAFLDQMRRRNLEAFHRKMGIRPLRITCPKASLVGVKISRQRLELDWYLELRSRSRLNLALAASSWTVLICKARRLQHQVSLSLSKRVKAIRSLLHHRGLLWRRALPHLSAEKYLLRKDRQTKHSQIRSLCKRV